VTLTNNEIFNLTIPNKVQAYMAVGKPILSAVNGACSDLISESSCGLSVPADDEFSLSAAVINMYNMPKNDLLKLGENGQKYFKKNFFHDDLVNELNLHMKRLVELA
jgi:glycosyltransferase involved in cell wall biosynthesis